MNRAWYQECYITEIQSNIKLPVICVNHLFYQYWAVHGCRNLHNLANLLNVYFVMHGDYSTTGMFLCASVTFSPSHDVTSLINSKRVSNHCTDKLNMIFDVDLKRVSSCTITCDDLEHTILFWTLGKVLSDSQMHNYLIWSLIRWLPAGFSYQLGEVNTSYIAFENGSAETFVKPTVFRVSYSNLICMDNILKILVHCIIGSFWDFFSDQGTKGTLDKK